MNVIFSDQGGTQSSDALNFPKVRKSCRSFKEIAEVTLSQLEYLLHRNYLKSGNGGGKHITSDQ
jgi:hypothetical protein